MPMKKFTLLLMSMLMVSILVVAQIKLNIHKIDGSVIEYIASEVEYIDFTKEKEDDESDFSINANGHEYVDLGLPSGTLWATCNIGAESPEEYGDYFAWGETQSKDYYGWDSYKLIEEGKSSSYYLNKYTCPDGNAGIWYEGDGEFIGDNKTVLDLSDDAANANWGGDWRMPTRDELEELKNPSNCTWDLITLNGKKGCRVTSKINGNSIFLPVAGYRYNSDLYYSDSYGYIWTSTLSNLSTGAYVLCFGSDHVDWFNYSFRCAGKSIRPVLHLGFTYDVKFDSNGGEGIMQSIAINHAEALTVPQNTFIRSGYEFINWNTKSNGTGIDYKEGEKFSVGRDVTLYAQWYKKETDIAHEYVDLGLPSGILWATCNVGASKPEDIGYFFSWGEIKPKSEYSWETYELCNGSNDSLIKYCSDSYYGIVDYKTILDKSDDAANANWGGDWRMPTSEEQDELLRECTTTWESKNGIEGYTFTGPNGNSIFLPAANFRSSDLHLMGSYGCYWSSSLSNNYSDNAYALYFNSEYLNFSSDYIRKDGLSVRPVKDNAKTDSGDNNDDPIKPDDNEDGGEPNDNPVVPENENFVAKPFSISENLAITFSSGNLQYHAVNNEWRFAPNQTDYVGEDNANISPTYNGWIDLFGWGTGNNPTNTSTDHNDYSQYSIFIDWGVNKIGKDTANTWRTLTSNEWDYLCFKRTNASKLKGVAQVDGVNGLILLPDNWVSPSNVAFKSGFHSKEGKDYYADYQIITASDWSKLEESGAVFLPAAGSRSGSNIRDVQSYAGYWSSSRNDSKASNGLSIFSNNSFIFNATRTAGHSIRLVKDYDDN